MTIAHFALHVLLDTALRTTTAIIATLPYHDRLEYASHYFFGLECVMRYYDDLSHNVFGYHVLSF